MDMEKLIEQYMQAADKWEKRHPVTDTFDLRVQDALRDAATALSTLQAENENLRAEMEQIKTERDAAVEDLRQMCVGGNTCAFCKKSRADCKRMGSRRKTVEPCWEWRGIKED